MNKYILLALLALITVFIIDLMVPLGIAVGMLYLFCYLIVCTQSKKIIIFFAVATSVLTLLKLVLFYSPDVTYLSVANRALTVLMIFIIAVLTLWHRRLAETIRKERNTYIRELEEMLFLTSHKIRRPLATSLGLMDLIETDKPLTTEEMKKVARSLKTSVLEMDAFIKELTTFVHGIKMKDKNKNGDFSRQQK